MKVQSAVAILLLLCSAASAYTDHTYVVNDASKAIEATMFYKNFAAGVHSGFVNRVVDANTLDQDSYTHISYPNPYIHIEVWVAGAGVHSSVDVDLDHSIRAVDGTNGCVDIYHVSYGTLHYNDGPVATTVCPDSVAVTAQ